jgi:hypothetical protein
MEVLLVKKIALFQIVQPSQSLSMVIVGLCCKTLSKANKNLKEFIGKHQQVPDMILKNCDIKCLFSDS